MLRYHIDTPQKKLIQRISGQIHVAGWCFDDHTGMPADRVFVQIGKRKIVCTKTERRDVTNHFNSFKIDLFSGFYASFRSKKGLNKLLVYAVSKKINIQIGHFLIAANFTSSSRRNHDYEIISSSGLFNDSDYFKRYPNASKNKDAIRHFIEIGQSKGYNPHLCFDTDFYLQQNEDVKVSGVNAFSHYIKNGAHENRNSHPKIEVAWLMRKLVLCPSTRSLEDYFTNETIRNLQSAAALITAIGQKQSKCLGTHALFPSVYRIAVGIVTYNNGERELTQCLRSLDTARSKLGAFAPQTDCSCYIIDNGEPTPEELLTPYSIRQLSSVGNIGFGSAHNRLMAQAFNSDASAYIALNPDGMFHPMALLALAQMSLAENGQSLVEALQFPEEHPKEYDLIDFTTEWASGACLLIPRAIYEKVGGFDDRFFMYCEDVDLSWRARKAGFTAKTCPRAFFYHPVTQRGYDETIHARFLQSGIKLAQKWNAPATFQKTLFDQTKSLKLDPPKFS